MATLKILCFGLALVSLTRDRTRVHLDAFLAPDFLYPLSDSPGHRSSKGDPKQVMEELARHHLIKRTVAQGYTGDVPAGKIVHDAQTTSGFFWGVTLEALRRVTKCAPIPLIFGRALHKTEMELHTCLI